MSTTETQNDHLPGLLRLPPELRDRILLDVLSEGTSSCVPYYMASVDGFPLCVTNTLAAYPFIENNLVRYNPSASIYGVLSSCKQLYQDCLELLAENFTFIVQVNVRDDASTGANTFRKVQALDSAFSSRIKKLAIPLSFITPEGNSSFGLEKFETMMNPDRNPLMFEKIIENVNELLHLMPGVEKVHLVWNMFFGNGGIAMTQERYARQLWERLRKEWPRREIEWTTQTCMSVKRQV